MRSPSRSTTTPRGSSPRRRAPSDSARRRASKASSKHPASSPTPPGSSRRGRPRGTRATPSTSASARGDLLATPLQLANAYSAFLGGELRAPVILAGAEAVLRRSLPLAPEHAAHLRHGLELVTSARGTAGWAFADAGFGDFGGKSGTAEEGEGQEHSLFVAYSPRALPAAVAAVVFDDATEGRALAAPLARDLVRAALEAEAAGAEAEADAAP